MKIRLVHFRKCLLLAILAGLQACTNGTFNFIAKPSPHAAYSQKLTNSGINETLAGRKWLEVANNVLEKPSAGAIPFNVRGMIRARDIKAMAWQFDVAKGATITINVTWQNQGRGEIFVDLFAIQPEKEALISTSTKDSLVQFEFKKTGTYIIRLQPELFAEGLFELIINRKPTYAVFPVYGKNAKAVQSFWGAPRGGGSRTHEGIDIFAKKGTPVVAPVAGAVSAVRNRGLGGKQVWLRDRERGYNLYFAHLDSQTVAFGQFVNPGDTLGFVGNTGNAKFTPPHLHFGIYSGGAFDPFPMVENSFDSPKGTSLKLENSLLLVNSAKANFRAGPGTQYSTLTDFERKTPLFVLAAVESWYYVESPDSTRGYIHSSLLSEPSPATLATDSVTVYRSPTIHTDSMKIATLGFSMLGKYNGYSMIGDSLENFYYIRN